MPPPKIFKTWIFWIFWIFGGTFTAPTGGTVGVPRCHSLRLYMRYDKKMKSKKNPNIVYFFDEKYFSKDFEKSKMSKVTFSIFFEKLNIFKKVNFFSRKNPTFSIFRKSQLFRKKWFFEMFDFSKSFEKYVSSKKTKVFGNFLLFIFFIVSNV